MAVDSGGEQSVAPQVDGLLCGQPWTAVCAPATTRTQLQVRRVDRSIQAYERANDRGHVIYARLG